MQGTVVEKNSMVPLPGATIFKEVNGEFVGATSTDSNGKFYLSYDGRIKVTYIGYKSQILDPANGYLVTLEEDSKEVGAVTVIGKKIPKKASFPVKKLIIIGAIALVVFIIYKKKLFFW